ncbi:hypothetical protein BDZ89DRAFT_506302 [Hymenopellis radicata]|nr:hypothetical protein BDZ89DRAFT_506302 [Hymenopellis radicata]
MDAESYRSWLPPRPTNIPSTPVDHERTLTSSDVPISFGRAAKSRLVRVVSVPEQDEIVREPHPRRHAQSNHNKPPRPRFNAPNLHLGILTSPNTLFRVYFILFRTFIFAHLLLQTFFDFNVVYIIVQISKSPQPQAESGRSWSLAAAAYIACWALQILAIAIMYELVYLFIRRWRVKRPPIAPIYLTSSSFNYAAIQSYAHFCFINAIRSGAFTFGNIRDGLAETCWFYSQNLPTVTLLLPRAAISIVLLLNFSSVPSDAPTTGIQGRDGAFFGDDGSLNGYSRGILFVNAAWTAWRTLVLIVSWIGLWILSEQGCAGLCGPRYRWEEADYEKRGSALSDDTDHTRLPWDWRDCTRDRIQEIYELCLVTSDKRKRSSRRLPPSPIIPVVYTERSPLNSPSPHILLIHRQHGICPLHLIVFDSLSLQLTGTNLRLKQELSRSTKRSTRRRKRKRRRRRRRRKKRKKWIPVKGSLAVSHPLRYPVLATRFLSGINFITCANHCPYQTPPALLQHQVLVAPVLSIRAPKVLEASSSPLQRLGSAAAPVPFPSPYLLVLLPHLLAMADRAREHGWTVPLYKRSSSSE